MESGFRYKMRTKKEIIKKIRRIRELRNSKECSNAKTNWYNGGIIAMEWVLKERNIIDKSRQK
jgi:hypothetical protein